MISYDIWIDASKVFIKIYAMKIRKLSCNLEKSILIMVIMTVTRFSMVTSTSIQDALIGIIKERMNDFNNANDIQSPDHDSM